MPYAFFFLNLFLHVALPLGLGLVLWLHVSRLARPVLLPPRGLTLGVTGALLLLAVAWPLTMFPEADPTVIPDRIDVSWFYGFFLPLSRRLSPGMAWSIIAGLVLVLVSVPWLMRPHGRPLPSRVNEALCTGCTQCSLDCPYEAITMVERAGDRSELVARVDADRCVSCGICAGSCAPMGIGPPGRDGRSQLAQVRTLLAGTSPFPDVVVINCHHGLAGLGGEFCVPIDCLGNLHTSTVELCLRSGASGVLIVSCATRDCRNREGGRWLEQRLFHGREAELQSRVDRRRIRLVALGSGDVASASAALARFRVELAELDRRDVERDGPLGGECLTPASQVAPGKVA